MNHWMDRNEKSLIGKEWMIFWMNRNDWLIEWTGMIDSLHDQGCMIHWMNSNVESFYEQG